MTQYDQGSRMTERRTILLGTNDLRRFGKRSQAIENQFR